MQAEAPTHGSARPYISSSEEPFSGSRGSEPYTATAEAELRLVPPPLKEASATAHALPDVALPGHLQDLIHSTVWEVARLFGFQTFNASKSVDKSKQWTPATAFVASDHLTSLLQIGLLRLINSAELRNGPDDELSSPMQQLLSGMISQELFVQSVYELHSNIFHAYEVGWCPLVELSALPTEMAKCREVKSASSSEACHILLCELALYYLIWTEAANTRHLAEGMWFMFWCCCHALPFIELCCSGGTSAAVSARQTLGPRHAEGASLRDWRIHCRNEFQDVIDESQKSAGLDPGRQLPAAYFPARREQRRDHLPGMLVAADSIAGQLAAARSMSQAQLSVVTDLALSGDGGFWSRHMVTPIFLLLAQEMEAMAGEEHYHRLGYDDVNESLANSTVVHRTLERLGVTADERFSGKPNSALMALAVWIGSPSSLAPLGGSFADAALQARFLNDATEGGGAEAPAVDAWFVPQRAAAFWSTQVATKTFQERRSWLAVYRAFHRVFLLNLVVFHLMMAQSLSESWDWLPLSTAVLTHAGLTALERCANWVICTRTTSSTMRKDIARFGVVKVKGRNTLPAMDAEDPESLHPEFRALRLLRLPFRIEGSPWGLFGFLEWPLLFVCLVIIYVVQAFSPESWGETVSERLTRAWRWISVAYTACYALHFVLTTRPGYCISLSHALHLPAMFRASSSRPRPNCWAAGSLSVPLLSWLGQVVTWGSIYAGKWCFEYFAVSKALSKEIHSLLDFNNCDTVQSEDGQCINVNWLLIIVTVSPFVCLVMIDGMIAYHGYLTVMSVLAGVLKLNQASLPEWAECVQEFHRAPNRWWNKCVSSWGQRMVLNETYRRYESALASSGWREPIERAATDANSRTFMLRTDTLKRALNQGVAADLVKTAQFEAFSAAWDALVSDLREADYLTDGESHNCKFVRLHNEGEGWSSWTEAAMCVEPMVLPAFFFAGQIQRVVDTGRMNSIQSAVLGQLRNLALLLAVDLGLLSGEQANAVQAATFVAKPTSLAHLDARAKTLPAAVKLVTALLNVCKGRSTPKQGAKAFADALLLVMEGLEVESRAAGGLSPEADLDVENLSGVALTSYRALVVLLELQEAAKHTDALSKCLELLVPPPPLRPQSSAGAAAAAAALPAPISEVSRLAREIVPVLYEMLTTPAAATCPRSSEARRIISAFLNSLSLDSLISAPALLEARSLTVFTPLYAEEVMYCLEAEEATRKLGLGGADPAAAARGMSDLITPPGAGTGAPADQQGVTLLTYLRSVFPSEWDNFRERVARLAKEAVAAAASGRVLSAMPNLDGPRVAAFLRGSSLDIKDADFRENGALAPWALELQLWASFRAQVLARTARGMMCTERALRVLGQMEFPCPQGMPAAKYQTWLRSLSETKFTYLVAAQAYGKQRSSSDVKERWLSHCIEVLLAQHAAMRVAFLDAGCSVLIRGAAAAPAGPAATGSGSSAALVQELYRVRLPDNPYSPGRGIVVGEGKPENQNHALIFAFGESVQTVDMNQDGCMAEALKTRNLLTELSPVGVSQKAWGTALVNGRPPYAAGGDTACAAVLQKLREARLSGPSPTVICGFKEWIFSHKAGALASFAASTEYAFATVIQNDMARGNVRLHYGHPDVFDKLHIMTRGGLSKATRGLHVSEDVMGGLNHTLRGGRIAYTEAVSCGKGRDMGFNSILTFETKISCGNGEVLLSRDMARLAPRMDIFRLLHFYHSGLGYFTTARLLLLGIYCQALAMAMVALAGFGLVDTNIQLLIQIGLVSSLPYLAQLTFETGFFNAFIVFLRQLIAGLVAFSIFRMQTTAYYFSADIMFGGAAYFQTGRGFSYRPSSFVQLYASYSRSHLFLGFELGLLAVVVAASGTAGSSYGALMWGIWLVAASLIAAPFWFNPLSFNMDQVRKDWRQWRQWLQGEVDPELQSSWAVWNRRQLQKIRDEDGKQDSRWLAVLTGLAFTCLPQVLLAFMAAQRLTAQTSGFLLLTITLWGAVSLLLWVRAELIDQARFKFAARIRSLLGLLVIGLLIAFIVIVTRMYNDGSDHFFLSLYFHLCTLLALHAAATHLCSGLSSAGAVVDLGFWLLDCVTGTLLLAIVAILSFGGLFEQLQAVLLFNRSFAKSVKDSKTSQLFSQMRQGGDKGLSLADEKTLFISKQLKEAASAVGNKQATMRQGNPNFLALGTMRLKELIRGPNAAPPGATIPGPSGRHDPTKMASPTTTRRLGTTAPSTRMLPTIESDVKEGPGSSGRPALATIESQRKQGGPETPAGSGRMSFRLGTEEPPTSPGQLEVQLPVPRWEQGVKTKDATRPSGK